MKSPSEVYLCSTCWETLGQELRSGPIFEQECWCCGPVLTYVHYVGGLADDKRQFLYERKQEKDKTRGLYGKYLVSRADGAPLKGPVFVLSYETDPHARTALDAYASSCEKEYPQLAKDLWDALEKEK